MLPENQNPPKAPVSSTLRTNAERVGIYGGTFDPVHHGHLVLARDAIEALGLSRLIFIPAAISPHKLSRQPGASGATRLAMLMAAVAGEPRFNVDDCELHRSGPSYAIETVGILRAKLPLATELFYLIGQDNIAALHTWHRIAELMKLAKFVVFERGDRSLSDPAPAVIDASSFATLPRRVDISATEIRKRVASGRSIRYLLPEEVRLMIAADGLYRVPEPGANPLPLKN
jgi:nicotinate-nucleotide adenylyltransferase